MGITPACAGSIWPPKCIRLSREDHPRVCGEHMRVSLDIMKAGGSPPRVRGAYCARMRSRVPCRITPACAGSILIVIRILLGARDHPRVCGEH